MLQYISSHSCILKIYRLQNTKYEGINKRSLNIIRYFEFPGKKYHQRWRKHCSVRRTLGSSRNI